MKQILQCVLAVLLFSFLVATTQAQISINTDNSLPNPSAMLDIKSNDRGLLIPRMDSTARENILNPAEGLMVYDSTTHSFWYYKAAWMEIDATRNQIADTDQDTKIQVEESADEDVIRFDLNGAEKLVLKQSPSNDPQLELLTSRNNIFIGTAAGNANTFGFANTFIGPNAGEKNTEGDINTFIGASAGSNNITGIGNTFIGYNTGFFNETGDFNTFIGDSAGATNTSGTGNTFIGRSTGFSNTQGINNTYIGLSAGLNNTSGSGNVFLGHQAGAQATTSNKLYIDNTDTIAPLIYGDFAQDILRINGHLGIGIGTNTPSAALEVNGAIKPTGNTLLFNNTNESGTPDGDGLRLRLDGNYFNTNGEAFIFEKTDGNANSPDDAIVFANTGNDGNVEEALVIRGNGNIGIGLNDPSEKLEVEGDVLLTTSNPTIKFSSGNLLSFIENSLFPGLSLPPFTAADQKMNFHVSNNTANGTIRVMTLNGVGNVGIGENDPNVALDVNGSIEYTGTITDVSDRRLKENLLPVQAVLPKLLQLQAYTYNMKNDPAKEREYGLMAQEVQALFPEMVSTIDAEGEYLGLSYMQLIPVLLEGMKEQQTKIQQLETQLAQIQAQLNQ